MSRLRVTMMGRHRLMDELTRYENRYPNEKNTVKRVRALVTENADCFERTCLPGHITGSAWIVSPDHSKYLLTHHRKLDRWLQLGGHADGCDVPHHVALREAIEESGLPEFGIYMARGRAVLLDMDVHHIPARGSEPVHEHHDLRYLLIASAEQPLKISEESHDLAWFDRESMLNTIHEESLLRLSRKGAEILKSGMGSFVFDNE